MSDEIKTDELDVRESRTEETALPLTGVKKKPRLRNVRVRSATADDRIYSYGFAIGGGRLRDFKPTTKQKDEQ